MKRDLWYKKANANKFEGYIDGKEVWSNPCIPEGIVYFINEDYMSLKPKFKKKKSKITKSALT